MHAAIVDQPGGEPRYGQFPDPTPGQREEVRELVGAGLHNLVRARAAGSHYSATGAAWPLVPGVDAVARDGAGQLVYTGWTRAPWGTMAERMATPFGLPLPDGADPLAVAAGMNPGMSGFLPLALRREEQELETVAVTGATGMSGTMAVHAALHLGARRVIAIGRDADLLSDRWPDDDRVHRIALTGDPSADSETLAAAFTDSAPALVLDYVWGTVAEAVLQGLVGSGADDDSEIAYCQIGSMAGSNASIPAAALRSRRLVIRGSGIGSIPRATVMRLLPAVLDAIASGAIPVPYRAFELPDIAQAWAWSGRERVVITPTS